MRLIEEPGEITSGALWFEGRNLAQLSENDLNSIRGKDIAMIFQEPVAALNPVMKVGAQIVENIECQRRSADAGQIPDKRAFSEIMRDMLGRVGLDWQRTENLYPHELSGGMAQRVMIAMALSSKPKLLIADEPTSALDVTIQAQILNLLNKLVRETQTAVLLITHAMGVAAQFCDFIAVMYAGNVVEYGSVQSIFRNPLHPYTKGLLNAVPKIGRTDELQSIPGIVPDLIDPPSGCPFSSSIARTANPIATHWNQRSGQPKQSRRQTGIMSHAFCTRTMRKRNRLRCNQVQAMICCCK